MIVKTSDGVVIYDNAWKLTAQGARCGEKIDRTTTTDNATQIDGVALPNKWQGGLYTWTDEGGFVVANASQYAAILTLHKSEAKYEIDNTAEKRRQDLWITPGDGQAQEYRKTEEEIAGALVDQSPSKAKYPYLWAERQALADVGVNMTYAQVAAAVQTTIANPPVSYGADIKYQRRKAKMSIDDSTTIEGVDNAKANGIAAISAVGA